MELVKWRAFQPDAPGHALDLQRVRRIDLNDCTEIAAFEPVGLELPILALIPGLGNVAWRTASDLR